MSEEKCENCRFFKQTEDNIHGVMYTRERCRRHPPIRASDNTQQEYEHPVTSLDSWCGEWRPKSWSSSKVQTVQVKAP
jgi:hypothetical protein